MCNNTTRHERDFRQIQSVNACLYLSVFLCPYLWTIICKYNVKRALMHELFHVCQAFEQARLRQAAHGKAPQSRSRRPKVTVVHKILCMCPHLCRPSHCWQANVLSLSDGLFRECALEVAKRYPDIQVRSPKERA
jgi:hypothetical protein